MAGGISRRHFFFGTLLAGVIPRSGFGSVPSLQLLGYRSPNEKLNIACIGAGGRATANINGCASENIVAFADPDSVRAGETYKRYEAAPKYTDYRKMFDKEAKNIDAVIITTPDHMHAITAVTAMQLGKHVYVEKPLTRTPWEAQLLTQAAAKYKVATQMGNQGYSHEANRVAAEMLWSGEIGAVREVHASTGAPSWPQGLQQAPAEETVPPTLDWDVWLGGAACARTALRICRSTGAGFSISARVRSATGVPTFSAPCILRCVSRHRHASRCCGRKTRTRGRSRRGPCSAPTSRRAVTCRRSPSTGTTLHARELLASTACRGWKKK